MKIFQNFDTVSSPRGIDAPFLVISAQDRRFDFRPLSALFFFLARQNFFPFQRNTEGRNYSEYGIILGFSILVTFCFLCLQTPYTLT